MYANSSLPNGRIETADPEEVYRRMRLESDEDRLHFTRLYDQSAADKCSDTGTVCVSRLSNNSKFPPTD